jgi:hypothetical protein
MYEYFKQCTIQIFSGNKLGRFSLRFYVLISDNIFFINILIITKMGQCMRFVQIIGKIQKNAM